MRLDHLLSKERLALPANVGGVQSHISVIRGGSSLVEHWLFGLGGSPGWLVRPLAAWNAGSWGSTRPSTLLGPEGTAAWPPRPGPVTYAHVGDGGRDRPYLENCTVDASIFCSDLLREVRSESF